MKNTMNRFENSSAEVLACAASFPMDDHALNCTLFLAQLLAVLGLILPIILRITTG